MQAGAERARLFSMDLDRQLRMGRGIQQRFRNRVLRLQDSRENREGKRHWYSKLARSGDSTSIPSLNKRSEAPPEFAMIGGEILHLAASVRDGRHMSARNSASSNMLIPAARDRRRRGRAPQSV